MPDGRTVHMRVLGDSDGHPVLISPGSPVGIDGPMPDPMRLRDEGIFAVVVERPGYGDSTPLPGRTVAHCAYDITYIATEVFGFERYSVLGRSGGGSVALAVGALDPEHVDRVAAVVGTSPSLVDTETWTAGMGAENRAVHAAELEEKLAVIRRMAAATRLDGRWLLNHNTPSFTATDHMWVGENRDRLVRGYERALRNYPDAWTDDAVQLAMNWGVDLGGYRVPVDLVHGTDDRFSPTSHSRMNAALIPTSKLYLFPGTSHMMGMDMDTVLVGHFDAERKAYFARSTGNVHLDRDNARTLARIHDRTGPPILPDWFYWRHGRWDGDLVAGTRPPPNSAR
ncbi:alpha/beta hydrolase [Nocardia sp. alder85J]|uniref:alpha/beta fold hydrolase n=1 Tax=Nocardia sp. alder85J TaxID=2862949 RepID=UPI002B1CDBCC|nr:alpha/beta hydrolase [Nocardia sp. alder85J]